MAEVTLRATTEDDLPAFFEFQRDPVANEMAAFPARDHEAFMEHWRVNILGDAAVRNRTILYDGVVAGNIGCWGTFEERLVGYWIARELWGKGIATRALSLFLLDVGERPLYAHAAKHNVGSIRVLEKCGFAIVREQTVEESGGRIDEVVLRLDGVTAPAI